MDDTSNEYDNFLNDVRDGHVVFRQDVKSDIVFFRLTDGK